MKDFWLACGHHLLDRDEGGGLLLTDEFLKVYLARPELTPPSEACIVEKTLHAALLAEPRRHVTKDEIAAIADADARENWGLMIAFRDHLVKHRTLEAAYVDLVRKGVGSTPPLFLSQLVHVILRNALDGCEDPQILRAAEIFFRPQRLTLHEGSLIAADEEAISGTGAMPASPLVSMLGIPAQAEIDVLNEDNAHLYWEHSDLFHTAIDLLREGPGTCCAGHSDRALDRPCDGDRVSVEPLSEMREVDLNGMSASMSKRPASAMRCGTAKNSTRRPFPDRWPLPAELSRPTYRAGAGRPEPVYLILAMSRDKIVRMKPQNLIAGLPVRQTDAVS